MANKIYFIGGGSLVEGELRKIDQVYIQSSKNKSIFVVDVTTNEPQKIKKYRDFLIMYFKELGAKKVEFYSSCDVKLLAKKIRQFDILYLPGGNVNLLLENIKKNKIERLIRNFKGDVVGNSAGALVLCNKMLITKDENNYKTRVLVGLGLVDFSVEVHYNGLQDNELIQIKKVLPNTKIYAIPERCALIYSSGSVSMIGDVKVW